MLFLYDKREGGCYSPLFFKKIAEDSAKGNQNRPKKITRGNVMRTTFQEFKKKALADPQVEKEYRELSPAYAWRKQLIRIRKDAGLTQAEIAELLKTNKSNISRLENVHSTISPRLSTLEKYAEAAGYDLQINFVPQV